MLTVVASPLSTPASAQIEEIQVIETAVNPANNHTYYLLSASSWTEAAEVARSLDGFLVTVDDAEEDQWLYDTFANNESEIRHLWIGLNDENDEGDYRWHDGTPFIYRNWGDGQPGDGDDEDYVHITGTNMGSIEPASWNDLEDDPQYFPVFGVVEVGEGADYALRFDGDDDHIMVEDDLPEWEGHIEISAWVNVPVTDGIQFVTMFGDYGWGLYLNDGYLAYSNDYSLSQNPNSNISIQENVWTHIKVIVEEGIGGEFFIDNLSSGLISAEDAMIPAGDFGSNDCYQSGEECDELYIGRMGAGCDCNYFRGLMDDLMIKDATNESSWDFPEGEGSSTHDFQGRHGEIHGAAWVMPDGSIIAQAIQLFSDESIGGLNAEVGDTLLFFMEIPENTQFMDFETYRMFDWESEEEDYFESEIEILASVDEIPSTWEHDYELETYGDWSWNSFDWPEEGVWWFTITTESGFEDLEIYTYWELAPEPPELDEMTELTNGIAVTGQTIKHNSGDSLYFYTNVTEPLAELRTEIFGGEGNCDLHIAWKVIPNEGEMWFDDWDEFDNSNGMPTSDSSYERGNNDEVKLFDADVGIYYIMMTAMRGCKEVTIEVEYTFAPNNVEPEDAIELQAGVTYGPLSGYEGLDQYFYIDVPIGTERIEVDLADGDGEAKLLMRLENYPTWSTFDMHSNSPGANDKIAFNDPTPGRWYILLASEESFSAVTITASFTERYVWSYDGEPIQLFNGEDISGIEAPDGEEMFFFIELGSSDAMGMQIMTWGGEGDVKLEVTAEEADFGPGGWDDEQDWDEEEKGRQADFQNSEYISDYGGPEQEIWIFMTKGRVDITLTAESDLLDVGIIAQWEEFDNPFPEPELEPEPEPERQELMSCIEWAELEFIAMDTNGDGDISREENRLSYGELGEKDDDPDLGLDELDLNDDDILEFNEFKQFFCSCQNEIELFLAQHMVSELTIERFASQAWNNEYDFFAIDSDNDMMIDYGEIRENSETCVTTYDAFDRDGDGTPDDKDDFPDDPSETNDADGDGVGDNADFASSIDNNLIYTGAGIAGVILVLVLVLFMSGTRGGRGGNSWDRPSEDISERMLDMSSTQEEMMVPPALDLGPVQVPPEDITVQDLFD